MFGKKLIRSITTFGLLLLTAWIAVPKVYVHNLFNHNHEVVKPQTGTQFQSDQSAEDCDFEEYNKPVYFHIFTFISKIIPVKPRNSNGERETGIQIPNISVLISLLRAPPANS